MPKINEILSNIFSRSKQLETDAVPASDENDESNQIPAADEIYSVQLPSHELQMAQNTNQQIVPSPIGSAELISSNGYPSGSSANNNLLAINNTQAQNVYQFSNINKLHIGSVYKIGSSEGGDQKEVPRTKPVFYTRTIQTMLLSDEPLNERYLGEISKHLGEGWQDIMRQLKFSEGQIHQAVVDFQIDGGLKEVIYQLLLDWSRNENNATLGEISKILWNSGHKDTIYYLKQYYKRNSNNNAPAEKDTI